MYYMPETEMVSSQLERFENTEKEAMRTKEADYSKLYQEYTMKKQEGSFSSSEAEINLIKKVESLQREINVFYENWEYRYNAKKNELMQPILTRLQAAIDAVAEENGYTYILNQTSGSNILYGVAQYDVTNLIAAKLGISIPN